MPRLRIGAAQINAVVGDLDGNAERATAAYEAAVGEGCDLVVFPELMVTGYPPEDLLLKPAFVAAASETVAKFAARTGDCAAVIGFPEPADYLYNSAAVCAGGEVVGVYRKQLLPNYSVFDEKRYFAPSAEPGHVFEIAGVNVGVSICEDAWSPEPITALVANGAELIVNINASPYYAGRLPEREEMLAGRAAQAGVPIVYVNLVGGQDELVFDGASLVYDGRGNLVARGKQFAEDLLVADIEIGSEITGRVEPVLEPTHEIYEALVVGTRDYVRKNGFTDVLISLSGGIDSSLVAAVAIDALGPEHVHGVMLPSRYSSDGSVADAQALTERLGFHADLISIEPAQAAFEAMLAPLFEGREPDLAEENAQARIRGNVVMTISNKFNWMVLSCGNKSEMATGYATLYGDMAGGLAVIKDVPKTLVYRLCRDLNARKGLDVIPQAVLDKAPSAELRPDQKDTDSLPEYDVLDPIIEGYVEGDESVAELAARGFDEELARRVARMVDRNEYKRRQSPPGVRISRKAFGKDRRPPITNRWPG